MGIWARWCDVLKPHQPNALDFAHAIAALGEGYRVDIQVIEVDEQTETLQVSIEGGFPGWLPWSMVHAP